LSRAYFAISFTIFIKRTLWYKKLYTISNALFKLLALENKYNKNKLLILNKIDNFATNIQAIIELIQQFVKEKSNLVD